MDKNFNKKINEIQGLYYLPWIGEKFVKSETKLLVLGESNYINPEGFGKEKDWNKILIKQNFAPILYEPYKVLVNLSKALYNKSDVADTERKNIAQYMAFSNIVQRPLKNRKERPTYNDFYNGWKIIIEIINIIKPKNIIVIGVSSIEILKFLAHEENRQIFSFKKSKNKISNISPRIFLINNMDGNINCISIKHTSSYFSWNKWHKFIVKNINLSEIIKPIN